ncbi:HD domain-containing protein [Maritimibacter alkaliphilus]|uniref:HD domain-containing protein n=1 Tax=Maritimibacter alkaliphilus TaxID=404236 RepID=UPI001C94D22A|nr:HD domain-containing protein [Maritimibacter alkaliphilus]MBY6092818.1 HD domain-containing protein [Maritimibacter alkaliphilus]
MTGGLSAEFALPELAAALLPQAFDREDGAHDHAHLLRVWRNAARIAAVDGGDLRVLTAAVILHDGVWVSKTSPHRAQASQLAGARAAEMLGAMGWDAAEVAAVVHAIEAHSFSAGISPESHEARVLRDADRLDAIGMVGVARCFYLAGTWGAALYDPADPTAERREEDDAAHALDHFRTKLMRLGDGFLTGEGQRLAAQRMADLRHFYDRLLDEIA